MFSNSPFSAAPFSSLEENLVEGGASLDGFSFLNLNPILEIIPFAPTYMNANGNLIALSRTNYYGNIGFNCEGNVNSSAIIKSYVNSVMPGEAKLYSDTLIQVGNTTIFNGESKVYTTTLIRTLGDLRMSGEARFLSTYLNRVHGNTIADGEAGLNIDSLLKNFNMVSFQGVSNMELVGKIQFYPSLTINPESSIVLTPNIYIDGKVTYSGEANFLTNYLSRTVGDLIFRPSADLELNSLIKTYGSVNLNAEGFFDPQLVYQAFNSTVFLGNAGFIVNLSQKNQDIVYYILNDKTTKTFTLNIMRVKI